MHWLNLIILPIFPFVHCQTQADGEKDLVKQIPGLIFKPNFKTYSGYLYCNDEKTWKMFYMLNEARRNPETAPVVFWFSGGPGCSSFSEAFQQMGPFYIHSDAKTIYENVYSWNYQANMVYIESPVGVGFSYDTTNLNFSHGTDDLTAMQNKHAINDFFTRVFPKYASRKFYLTGSSYAGIYLPMLADSIVSDINLGDFKNLNFAGMAIGNGCLDTPGLMNSLVLWSNYHGRFSLKEWNTLKYSCCNGTNQAMTSVDPDSCDWTSHMISQNGMDFIGKNTTCGKILNDMLEYTGFYSRFYPYNFYQSCYAMPQMPSNKPANFYKNPANLINRDSTDPFWGYQCLWFGDMLLDKYLDNPKIWKAFNVDTNWIKAGKRFGGCNTDLYNQWNNSYLSMTRFFESIISNVTKSTYPIKNFHILVYNGDVDTVCNYLGAAKFVEKLSKDAKNGLEITSPKSRWYYRQQECGYVQSYSTEKSGNKLSSTF